MDIKPVIDLKTLYYFTILAEEKHFGLAAKRIGIEQPPLSTQIKKLEEKVGGKLFDRSNKRVRLTDSGEILLPEALRLLAASKNVLDKVRKFHAGEAGTLQIGFTSSTIFCGLPDMIQKHMKTFPEVEFSLRERSPGNQIEELLQGTLDIGFIREPEQTEGIKSIRILDEGYVVVLAGNHPLANKKTIRLKELKDDPFVLFPKNISPIQHNKINEIFSAAGFIPKVVQEAFEWQTIINLVEVNLGVSICPASFQKMQIGNVKYINLTDVKIRTGVSACINSKNSSGLVNSFLKLIENGRS